MVSALRTKIRVLGSPCTMLGHHLHSSNLSSRHASTRLALQPLCNPSGRGLARRAAGHTGERRQPAWMFESSVECLCRSVHHLQRRVDMVRLVHRRHSRIAHAARVGILCRTRSERQRLPRQRVRLSPDGDAAQFNQHRQPLVNGLRPLPSNGIWILERAAQWVRQQDEVDRGKKKRP
jgi:hypothetical protein